MRRKQNIFLDAQNKNIQFEGRIGFNNPGIARYTCIARSGIGLMVSCFSMIIPEIYNRLNPFDSNSIWDFTKATPGIVVIVNTLAWDEFKRRFGTTPPTEEFIIASYRNFVQRIRSHYPGSKIICVLGNMDAVMPGSAWPGYIEKAVASLHDKKVYTHFFPSKTHRIIQLKKSTRKWPKAWSGISGKMSNGKN